MPSCTFIKPGLFTTIQDQGRTGLAYYAIPRSGVMDSNAADRANTLVGNELTASLIETTMIGPTILFHSATTIALTGADMQWKINDQPVSINRSLYIQAGEVLKSGSARTGIRSYLAIQGKIMAKESYGSCSTYSYAKLGHNEGQALKKGEELRWEVIAESYMEIELSSAPIPRRFQIFCGPEYDLLADEAKAQLVDREFMITPDSNRMGARLAGPQLMLTAGLEKSVAVLPGFIQLPMSGQPIVILQDGQTTGGYPRIAYMRKEELSLFNQLAFKVPFKFYL